MELDSIFTLEDGLPVVNKAYRGIQSIERLIKKNRTKSVNKELAYIFFVLNGDYDEKPDKEKIIRARIGLPEHWEPSKEVLEVLEELREDTKTVTERLLEQAIASANDYLDLFVEIRKNSKNVLENLRVGVEILEPDAVIQRNKLIMDAKQDFKDMAAMSKQLTEMFDNYNKLMIQVKTVKRKKVVGGKTDRLQIDKDIYARDV